MQHKLSIVTAAYNSDAYIEDMILSVINQPEAAELIIVNDGSSDLTESICRKYADKNKNIVYVSTENKGAGSARNTGIKYATGEWIAFLDSDDLLLENALDVRLYEYLSRCLEENVDIIYTARSKTDMSTREKPVVTYPESPTEIKYHMPRLEFWTCIYRKVFLDKYEIRFFTYREQDIESAFRYRAFSRAQNIVSAPEYSFYLQRNNPNSNMHTFNHYRLNMIKALVYEQLIKEQEENLCYMKDRAYLQMVQTQCIFHFFKYVWENGWEAERTEKDMKELWESFEKMGYIDFQNAKDIGIKRFVKYCLEIILLKLAATNSGKRWLRNKR